ncbi:potassium channel family protein [Glycomyces endophyticus]|uniref:Potassium channel family protein n=1 Tax=Glycomyces endophyticus TaxID=480996 RepID=A0ABN2HM22_9ACTN
MPAPLRYAVACAALAVAYAVAPVKADADPAALAFRWTLTAAMLVVLALAIRWQAVRQLRDPRAPLGGLVVGVLAGVLVFALIDFAVAVHRPGEFTGIATRVDALYFAISTLLTVGFGDVHASGQIARGLLCAQMAFNIIAIAGSASLVARKLTLRARQPSRRRRDHDGTQPSR